jgi:hypothetical protein
MVTIKGKVVSVVSRIKKDETGRNVGNTYDVYLVGFFGDTPVRVKFEKPVNYKEGEKVEIDCTQSVFNGTQYNKAV